MKITDLKLEKNKEENSIVKAFAKIVLDHSLIIHNMKIIEGKNRLFIAFPDRKIRDNYVNTVHPINSEFREYIESEILKEYQEKFSK